METNNIGVLNLIFSNVLKESYFSHDKTMLVENKNNIKEFISTIKNSKILWTEFKVFDNLENKQINDDISATRYIDNNIKLFETYTLEEIGVENNKLNKFFSLNTINDETNLLDENKLKLYDSILRLILESLKVSDEINVDVLHESFDVVLKHVKKDKIKEIIADENSNKINENIIQIAINKFNEKYSTLVESDKTLIKQLIKSDNNKKRKIFEKYKDDNIKILNVLNEEKYNGKIVKTIKKIDNMLFNNKTINEDIIDLHDLKQGLV